LSFGTWVQVTGLIESGRGNIGHARSQIERYSRDYDWDDFSELVKQLRDVAEGRELARNYNADNTAIELAAYGTALLVVRVAGSGGSGGGLKSAQNILRAIVNRSDESSARRIIDEIASIARTSRDESRAEDAAELVSFGRSII